MARKKQRKSDPRTRWVSTLAADVPPGPEGQPAHRAGDELQVLQVVTLPELGRVGFAAPSPSLLLLSAASPHVMRATRLQKQLPRQTTDKGFIRPFMDRRFTNDKAVLDFFRDAMAAILLLHASLDSYANESMPDGFELAVKGKRLSREDLEQKGIELRLSRALSAALGKPNLMTSETVAWEGVVRLKGLRDDIAHVKSVDAYSKDPSNETLFARLLAVDLHALVSTVQAVMAHYGKAPRAMPAAREEVP